MNICFGTSWIYLKLFNNTHVIRFVGYHTNMIKKDWDASSQIFRSLIHLFRNVYGYKHIEIQTLWNRSIFVQSIINLCRVSTHTGGKVGGCSECDVFIVTVVIGLDSSDEGKLGIVYNEVSIVYVLGKGMLMKGKFCIKIWTHRWDQRWDHKNSKIIHVSITSYKQL